MAGLPPLRPQRQRDIQNYNDRYEVQNCELVNPADLSTGAD